jgi:hypothetical protein
MDWVVAVSETETAGGELASETASRACAAFDEHGCVLLRGAFPSAIVEAMHRDYLSQFGTLDWGAMQREADKPPPNRFLRVGGARYDITLRMTGAFGRPEVFANGLLLKLLGRLLGNDFHLSNFTTVVSHPGASMQHFHRDHDHLFFNPGVGPNLPVYAINVAVPLIDVDLKTGPTAVWPGSHRWPTGIQAQPEGMQACPIRRGDCMLLDYRTLHTGLPNQSAGVRPILYMVYARGWFCDDATHFGVNSPDMPLEDYNGVPESARMPLYRALSQAVRNQGAEIDRAAPVRAPARNPTDALSWGKVGRNDPCPCGSGRKYKQCHGRAA